MPTRYGERWETISSLDEGGQAQAFLVRDLRGNSSEQYVLKRLKNLKRADRFKREVETVRNLSHENIVRVFDFDLEDEKPYYVMEYCEGGSLRKADPFWRDSPAIAFQLFQDICEGVLHAHAKGVIHRDLKPDNIFLRSKNGPPVVGDFGICYVDDYEGRLTLTEEAAGPRLYIAPELEDGKADQVTRLSDVYSLGKVLWWLLADGREVFSREQHRAQKWDLRRSNAFNPNLWDNIYMEHVNRVLDHMVVDEPGMRKELNEILILLKRAVRLVTKEYTPIGRNLILPCTYCGEGIYKLFAKDTMDVSNFGYRVFAGTEWRILICEACGHVQTFRVDMASNKDRW